MATYYGANWHYNKVSQQPIATRACQRCGISFPLDEYELIEVAPSFYKRAARCNACRELDKAEQEQEQPKTRKCPACGREKALEEFKSKSGAETRNCRKCLDKKSKARAAYIKAKKERAKE